MEETATAPTKSCTKCGTVRPMDGFYRSNTSSDGHVSQCKECHRERQRQWSEANRSRGAAVDLAADYVKPCTKCGETRPAGDFYPAKRTRDGLAVECKSCARARRRDYARRNKDRETAYSRRWRNENRQRYADYMNKWRSENKDRMLEANRAWASANAERLAELKHDWYVANRDRILANLDREQRRENNRRWALNNPDRRALAQQRRRAAQHGAAINDVDLAGLWTGTCALCGQEMDGSLAWPDPMSKSLDHIVPLSLGGPHETQNLQYAHLLCNVRKGNRL